jgi:hypothetical protein
VRLYSDTEYRIAVPFIVVGLGAAWVNGWISTGI